MKRSNLAWLIALVLAAAPVSSGGAAAQAGVGSAHASAVPLQLSVGGASADLLDIFLRATTDPQRAGTSTKSASAKLTALRVKGPQPMTAGELESAAADGESDQDQSQDLPLSAPGLVLATLQSATSAASVDGNGSRASAGARLVDFSFGGGLVSAETITSEMSVEATATGVTATKTLDMPSISALRVGDLADAAGIAISSLSVEQLLEIANTLALGGSGTLGDLLAQEQDQSSQLAAAQDALAAALAEQAQAQAALDAAEATLAEAQTQLALDIANESSASSAVDAAQTAVANASSTLAAAQADLDDAEADLATLQLLTLATPGAVSTLQGLATKYGVGGTVTVLNFLTKLVQVSAAVENAVAAAQAAVVAAQADLNAAEAALSTAEVALVAASAAVVATESEIVVLQAEIASLNAQLAALSPEIAILLATIASVVAALDATIIAISAYTDELRTLIGGASIVTFEGVHIVLRASAAATGGVPTVEVFFDRLSLGTIPAAQNVSTIDAAVTLLPQIASAVNAVGGILGLPAMDVDVLDTVSSSGTDGDGYRFASVSFTLFSVSVPTPDGATLTLNLGDPEVFAEFAPAGSTGGGSGGGGSGGGGSGGGTTGGSTGGGTGDGADPDVLPVTGLPNGVVPGLASVALAFAFGAVLWRPRRQR